MTHAITIRDLGKRYRLGETVTFHGGLRRRVKRWLGRGGSAGESRVGPQHVWALREMNLDVPAGQVLGIIGHNGAGKSTLLKILSRITAPSTGEVRIRGRVASLLEVGTGFHHDLTGRENVFLNGSILGMSRREIATKFDAIIAFAELADFIDTPVKRYSTGMYTRLAFAVAAHLEPDVLIVDEVLSVGDAGFQKKCIGKMSDVAGEGRTVLFVSHSMPAVQRLCTRAVLLQNGRLTLDGHPDQVIAGYLKQFAGGAGDVALGERPREQAYYGKRLKVVAVAVVGESGQPVSQLKLGESMAVDVTLEAVEAISRVSIVVGIDDDIDRPVTTLASEESGVLVDFDAGQRRTVRVQLDELILNQGTFTVRVGARATLHALDLVRQATRFEVLAARVERTRQLVDLGGVVRVAGRWDVTDAAPSTGATLQ
jgi:lipopolysaccharide transport system ATP-binding protein